MEFILEKEIETKEIFTVRQVNEKARHILEEHIPPLWIEGEISNFSQPNSGHWYFTIKDSHAQIRCAMFRGHNLKIKLIPENGLQVLLHAQISLYEARGDYQLLVDYLEPLGDGKYQREFNLLKEKLLQEGLFDATQKKPIPFFPKCIGIISSPTGAALQDILKVIRHRYLDFPVIIYPTLVQGLEAPQKILEALKIAIVRKECDVLILARGGGSIEDLVAFNDETLAKAIFACPIPIITGIGHEIDFTIADFVADERAPTPSAAAAKVCPDYEALLLTLNHLETRLLQAFHTKKDKLLQQVSHLTSRLVQFQRTLNQVIQHLDYTEHRLYAVAQQLLEQHQKNLLRLQIELNKKHPSHHIEKNIIYLQQLKHALVQSIKMKLSIQKQELATLARALQNVSPLSILERGYSMVSDENKNIIDTITKVQLEQIITTRLSDGKILSRILEIKNN